MCSWKHDWPRNMGVCSGVGSSKVLTPFLHSAPQIAGQSGFVIWTRASRTCRLNLVSSRHQGNWSWPPTSPKTHLWFKCLPMSSILLILWEIVSYTLFQNMQLACIGSWISSTNQTKGHAPRWVWFEWKRQNFQNQGMPRAESNLNKCDFLEKHISGIYAHSEIMISWIGIV